MEKIEIDELAMKSLAESLRHVEFLAHLTMADINRVFSYVEMFSYRAGETIFKQGQRGHAFYIIYEGEVEVLVKKLFFLPSRSMSVLKSGHFFGETALIDRTPRSATVKALTPTKLFVFLVEAFDLVFKNNPAFAETINIISKQRKHHTQSSLS